MPALLLPVLYRDRRRKGHSERIAGWNRYVSHLRSRWIEKLSLYRDPTLKSRGCCGIRREDCGREEFEINIRVS